MKPVPPPPYCPHGFRAVLEQIFGDEWTLPKAPRECVICREKGWTGYMFKLPSEDEGERVVPVPFLTTWTPCPLEEGRCVVPVSNKEGQHPGPCLVLIDPEEVVQSEQSEAEGVEVPSEA